MGAAAVEVEGSSAAAAGDRNVGAGMVAAAGCTFVGDGRRARSGECNSAGWDGSAKVRGVVAGAGAGRGLSGEGDRRPVLVAVECAKVGAEAAEGDEAIGAVGGRGLSMVGEGDWGRRRSRCSIPGLPCPGLGCWMLGVGVVYE